MRKLVDCKRALEAAGDGDPGLHVQDCNAIAVCFFLAATQLAIRFNE